MAVLFLEKKLKWHLEILHDIYLIGRGGNNLTNSAKAYQNWLGHCGS